MKNINFKVISEKDILRIMKQVLKDKSDLIDNTIKRFNQDFKKMQEDIIYLKIAVDDLNRIKKNG